MDDYTYNEGVIEMLIDIDKIKVVDRIRKDFGDLQELADDIRENGLINPPVVTPDTFELIAGERRLKAMKLLGYQQIEVRPMSVRDALHQLKLEVSENENRKDFSFNEKMKWAEMLKDEYSKIAKENMLSGISLDQNQSRVDTNKLVAQDIEMSKETYRQAKYVHENADEEIIKQLDKNLLSINGAYLKIKQQKEDAENKVEELERTNIKLQNENRELRSKTPEVVERVVEVAPDDYEKMKREIALLEKKSRLNEEEVNRFNKLKEGIQFLTEQKASLGRQVQSATELAGLTIRLQDTLEGELAPIKFKRCMDVLDTSDIAVENLEAIIGHLDKWIVEMRGYLNKNTIIETDIIDVI